MTCSLPSRMAGPRGIAASHESSDSAWFPDCSAERSIEIAFSAIERRPARNAWLFEAAVHANTSSDMPLLKMSRIVFSASMAPFLFAPCPMTMRFSSFWMKPP